MSTLCAHGKSPVEVVRPFVHRFSLENRDRLSGTENARNCMRESWDLLSHYKVFVFVTVYFLMMLTPKHLNHSRGATHLERDVKNLPGTIYVPSTLSRTTISAIEIKSPSTSGQSYQLVTKISSSALGIRRR